MHVLWDILYLLRQYGDCPSKVLEEWWRGHRSRSKEQSPLGESVALGWWIAGMIEIPRNIISFGCFDTMRLRQYGSHLHILLKFYFLYEICCILVQTSLNFVSGGPINRIGWDNGFAPTRTEIIWTYECIDGSVQDCSISIANALEILPSCTKQSICVLDLVKGTWLISFSIASWL